MNKILLIFGIMVYSKVLCLDGDNICPEEERVTVNITQHVLRKVTIRNYKWCVGFPPRCSYYTEEQRYVPEVVAKEEIRTTNKCCPGFIEDKTSQTCIFDCSKCENGECGLNNQCVCQPGFWGKNCENACNDSRWGRNCEHECSCTKGDCNPITGYCNCPPGWKGSRCDEMEDTSVMTGNVIETTTPFNKQKFSTDVDNVIKHLTKYADRAHYPTFQKYFTFIITTTKPSTEVESDLKVEFTNSNEDSLTHSTTPTSVLSFTLQEQSSHENFVMTKRISTMNNAELSSAPVTTDITTFISRTDREQSLITATTDPVISVTQFTNIVTKEKVLETNGVSVTGTQTVSSNTTWFNQSPGDLEINLTTHQNEMHINNSHLIFSIGAVAGILATIILIVAVTVITTRNYARNKISSNSIVAVARNADKDSDGGISSVSIYTRSVFHAPLPEPPVFENATFATPLENVCVNGGTLETKIVCNMHTLNNKMDAQIDEFYDHPPSTGSYRAASIPEPPEKALQLVNSVSKEHLYDEIPCWKQPLPVTQSISSYYANAISKKN